MVIAYFLYDLYAMYVVFAGKSKAVTPKNSPYKTNGNGHVHHSPITQDAKVSPLDFVQAQPLIVSHHVAIGVILTPMMMNCLDHDPGELMIGCALIFEVRKECTAFQKI